MSALPNRCVFRLFSGVFLDDDDDADDDDGWAVVLVLNIVFMEISAMVVSLLELPPFIKRLLAATKSSLTSLISSKAI